MTKYKCLFCFVVSRQLLFSPPPEAFAHQAQILDVVLKVTQILFLWLKSCFNVLCMCVYIINTSTYLILTSCNSDIIQLLSFKLQVSVSLLKFIATQVLSLVVFLGH